jgi:mono/diheme cytochrome c family protein
MVSGLAAARAAGVAFCLFCLSFRPGLAASPEVQRGQYLVSIISCTDCHTPGSFSGHPDMSRFLGGSDVGFAVPGLGIFVAPNLTPDPATGLGKWSEAEIVTALTKGVRPDGRVLAPIMPWRSFANLTPADALAIASYLKSLPPVDNKVPGPFGPKETATVPVMAIVPGAVFAGLPGPEAGAK